LDATAVVTDDHSGLTGGLGRVYTIAQGALYQVWIGSVDVGVRANGDGVALDLTPDPPANERFHPFGGGHA
jgi:hypothetical protein